MFTAAEVALIMSVMIPIGLLLGYICRRDMQKTRCPYCTCRDHCNIGFGIDAACPEEDLKPCVCKTRNIKKVQRGDIDW